MTWADDGRTGSALATGKWRTPSRAPLLLETSLPGVFAAGDIRHGSVKRVASAVGGGATAIQLAHEYLREHRNLREGGAAQRALAAPTGGYGCIVERLQG